MNRLLLPEPMSNAMTESVEPGYFDPSLLEALRSMQMPGEPDLMQEVINAFVDDSGVRLVRAQDELGRGDFENLSRTAHVMKGSASVIGAVHMSRLAGRLELTSKAGNASEAAAIIAEIGSAFVRTRSLLESVSRTGG